MEENKKDIGWREVYVSPDMPIGFFLQFINVLNERLCNLEDITKIDGKTLTEKYIEESKKKEQEIKEETKGK